MSDNSRTWDIDALRIARIVWRHRGLFFSSVGVALALSVLALHVLPATYTVSMEVAPVTQSNQQVGGGLSALARLGGVNIPDLSGNGQFRLFISALNSRDTANALARDQHLMHELFASQWSEADQRWHEPALHRFKGMAGALLGFPARPWSPPSGVDVDKLLSTQLEIDDDPKSPVITLRLQDAKPWVSEELLAKLVHTIDNQLREKALKRANDYIAYLNRELELVTVADYRAALMQHMSEQEQVRMTASAANLAFAADVFSAPSSSAQPTSPPVIPVVIVFAALGALAGVFLSLLAEARNWRRPRALVWVGEKLGGLMRASGAG